MTATPLPANGPSPGERPKTCDASGMMVIHRVIRSTYAEAPDLVRGVRDGDHAHAKSVADHLWLLSVAVRAHHEGEDERLWPAIDERAPACALHVTRMKEQHHKVLAAVADLEPAVATWRASASTTDAAPVLAALARVNAAVEVHLPDEEKNIVPVMEYTITEAEIDWFREHGRKATPKGYMWPSIGLMLSAQPDGGKHFLQQEMPPPIRLLWRLVGQRHYAKYRAKLVNA